MKFFSVDRYRCVKCGACLASCPIKILKMDETMRLPVMVSKGEKICIRCGHCISVCPHRAISLQYMHHDHGIPLRHDWRIPPEKLEHFMKGRRSIRAYKKEPVDKAKLAKLIDIARYAPSGVNAQPVRWEIIYYKDRVHGLAQRVIGWMRTQIDGGSPLAKTLRMKRIVGAWDKNNDWVCRGAPHLVIAYAPKNDMAAAQDCTIALTYFELAAASAGIGTCWAGYASIAINMSNMVRRHVFLSNRMNCYGAMLVGYPKFNYHRIPARNKPHIIWR